MKTVIDERVKLPKALRHILFMLFGISGIALMTGGGYQENYIDSLLLFVSGVYAGLASYGAFSLISDIKAAKSIRGFFKNLINKFQITFYDSGNSE